MVATGVLSEEAEALSKGLPNGFEDSLVTSEEQPARQVIVTPANAKRIALRLPKALTNLCMTQPTPTL